MYRRSFLCLMAGAIAGCTSISSTLVNRQDNDMFIGNSNGKPTATGATRPFKGVPITLRVPTHLELYVKETVWLNTGSDGHLFCYKADNRHLFVEANLIETDKVFTVDPKRPAAGTLTYTLGFGSVDSNDRDNTQYFKSIANKLADQTITDVNTSLKTILPLLQKVSGGKNAILPAGGKNSLPIADPSSLGALKNAVEQNRVVAWKRFDLDAPDFETQVACFIDQHVNSCHAECPCP